MANYLRIAAAFTVSLLIVALVAGPAIYYLDQLELQGKIDPPRWLATPIALSLVGLTIGLTKILLRIFRRD